MSHFSIPKPEEPAPPVKRRRGRQPRPSLLSSSVKDAVARFAQAVGQPKVIEPAGFRDFRGWLAYIGSPSAITDWGPLVEAVLQDCGGDMRAVHGIKSDLVREIVKAVVIPRDGESSKLVSTNCGRQCARPGSGVTLMTILDKVFNNPRQCRDSRTDGTVRVAARQAPQAMKDSGLGGRMDRSPASSAKHKRLSQSSGRSFSTPGPVNRDYSASYTTSSAAEETARNPPHAAWSEDVAGPSRQTAGSAHTTLPSFRELEDSLYPRPPLGKRGRN